MEIDNTLVSQLKTMPYFYIERPSTVINTR